MNDTPRTEAFYAELYHESTPPEMVDMASGKERDFARTLERELAAVTEERDALWADGVHTCGPNCKRGGCVLRRELTAMTEQRDTLVTALEKIEERFTDGEDTHDDWQFMGTTAQQALTSLNP